MKGGVASLNLDLKAERRPRSESLEIYKKFWTALLSELCRRFHDYVYAGLCIVYVIFTRSFIMQIM